MLLRVTVLKGAAVVGVMVLLLVMVLMVAPLQEVVAEALAEMVHLTLELAVLVVQDYVEYGGIDNEQSSNY